MSDTVQAVADWTAGAEAITYQACAACSSLQYFRRSFCAACGAAELIERRASGEGVVYAATLVCRAATAQAREHVPYKIVLVDTIEGFRMMGHGNTDLEIGDRVIAQYRRFTGHLVPFFERKTT
jgi:uncharacterized OB-fold protein